MVIAENIYDEEPMFDITDPNTRCAWTFPPKKPAAMDSLFHKLRLGALLSRVKLKLEVGQVALWWFSFFHFKCPGPSETGQQLVCSFLMEMLF